MDKNNYSDLLKQVELKKAPEVVYEQLMEQIQSGAYAAGDKLPSERTLMAQFERSHPTIREALRRLESAGFIEVIPGGGAIVKEYRSGQFEAPLTESLRYFRVPVKGILEFIFAADPIIAGIAATNRTREQIDELEEIIDEAEHLSEEDRANQMLSLSKMMHIQIAEMTGNRLIGIVWKCLISFISFRDSDDFAKVSRDAITELERQHHRLYEAIRNGDSEKAAICCSRAHDIFSDILADTAIMLVKEEVEPVRPRKASEAIYEQLRDLIYSGELKPGDRLPPERQLVNAFGKSRAAVREALKHLEQQGYITITRGSGSVVNDFSTDEMVKVLSNMIDAKFISVDEIFELRSISETIGAEWAAARRSDEDVDRIKSTFDGWIYDGEREVLVEKGIDFTNAVSLASHNETVYILSRITSELMHNRYNNADIERSAEEHKIIYDEHIKILKEIEKGNIRGARVATINHLDTVRRRVLV